MKKNLFWYVNRLSKMTISELVYRIQEGILCFIDSYNYRSYECNAISNIKIENINERLGKHIFTKKDCIEKTIFDLDDPSLLFDNTIHFKRLNIPTNFDLRSYWESQRFNQLILYALRECDSDFFYETISLWMKKNPPLIGCNYISTMECAIRCINLYAALCIMKERGHLTKRILMICSSFFKINYKLIKHRISKFSSRGNHTIFEYAGLSVCCEVLCLNDKHYWLKKTFDEFDFQTNADGSGIEQSTAYHFFNVQVILLIQNYFGYKNLKLDKIQKAIYFCSFFQVGFKTLRIGDSDSSNLFSQVFVLEEFLKVPTTDKLITFNDAGIAILKNKKAILFFKYGQLGLQPLYGHGHYDFLSIIILDSSGVLLTADSQTFLYNSNIREKLRSSYFHSMPTCGSDDLKQVSAFSWNKNNTGTLIRAEYERLTAKYKRLDGVEITRDVFSGDDYFVLVDAVEHTDHFFRSSLLLLEDSSLIDFYVLDEDLTISPLSVNSSLVDYSEKYGSLNKNHITRFEAESSPKFKLVSVFNFGKHKLSYRELLTLFDNKY